MPFSLINALASFQAYINKALKPLLNHIYIIYLDDILIFSKDLKDHIKHMRKVLKRLQIYKLFIKFLKCAFSVKKVEFLRFIVNIYGIKMDPAYMIMILKWLTPRSFRDIQVFLRFINFYYRFIYKYLRIIKKMTDLLIKIKKGRKKGLFNQIERSEAAF